MNSRINRHSFRSGSSNIALFVTVFSAVFLLVVLSATLITFILPQTFAGTARLKIGQGISEEINHVTQLEIEAIESANVLDRVIDQLELTNRWGKQFNRGVPLNRPEALKLLKHVLSVRSLESTNRPRIEITAFSTTPDEAAELANEVAESYKWYRITIGQQMLADFITASEKKVADQTQKLQELEHQVLTLKNDNPANAQNQEAQADSLALSNAIAKRDELAKFIDSMQTRTVTQVQEAQMEWDRSRPIIIDHAVPNNDPVRPKKALNITLGCVLGAVLGAATGLLVVAVRKAFPKKIISTVRRFLSAAPLR